MKIEEMLKRTKGNYLIDIILVIPKNRNLNEAKNILGKKYKFCMFDYPKKTYPKIFIRGPRRNLRRFYSEAKEKGYEIEFILEQSSFNKSLRL